MSYEPYYNYILRRYQEDRIMPEQQLELCFGPNVTTCAHCGDLVHGSDVIIKQYYTGHMTDVEHWCSDDCHHAWYLQRLNQWGL